MTAGPANTLSASPPLNLCWKTQQNRLRLGHTVPLCLAEQFSSSCLLGPKPCLGDSIWQQCTQAKFLATDQATGLARSCLKGGAGSHELAWKRSTTNLKQSRCQAASAEQVYLSRTEFSYLWASVRKKQKKDFRKQVRPGANRSDDSVGEFHGMFTFFFIFFWTFTRVMNCFYIKN